MFTGAANKADTALLLADGSRAVRYAELDEWIAANRGLLQRLPRPALAFQFAPNTAGSIAAYLACLADGVPLGLGEPSAAFRNRLIEAYLPSALILPAQEPAPEEYELVDAMAGGELMLWHRRSGAYHVIPHRDLALMLATSGSTGDAKFVRLSAENLKENARSIMDYLGLGSGEVAVQSLPMHYSYGLSVLNSHLLAGATVALTGHSFMRPEFWKRIGEAGCTSFAGVPYMYETMQRLRINPADWPTMRTITQAGGHLRLEIVRHFNEAMLRRQGRMFVMYGQTEATARMSYVPAERLAEKPGSIGIAIPRGELWLEPIDGDATASQLHYRGPNVMLGYATEPADLARGDEQNGILVTGDLAERDADGFFRITGRLARFAKLFGKRINLASVETEVERHFGVRAAAIEGRDQLKIYIEGDPADAAEKIRMHLAQWLGIPPVALKSKRIEKLPLTSSGKKDYKALS